MKNMDLNIKVKFNKNYIKKTIFKLCKNIIFRHNGIIFGGYVRDYIIAKHYTNLFYKKYSEPNINMWDSNIDKETLARTLVPNDIDVYLKDNENFEKMMREITLELIKVFGAKNVNITNIIFIRDTTDIISYINNPISSIYRYNYDITIGKIPYITEGITININIDIIIADTIAPFGRLDFLCNGFIMTGQTICLSNNTGTVIDKLEILEKKELENKIIKQMINFTTDYCMKIPASESDNMYAIFRYNERACKRIQKLFTHRFTWEIRNLPIVRVSPIISQKIRKKCCICFDTIKKKEANIAIKYEEYNIIGSHMHSDCFFTHMYKQIEEKRLEYLYNDLEINKDAETLKCPHANIINFNCNNIENIIGDYLNAV
jgi:hypothetical protein